MQKTWFRGTGCGQCGQSGYQGRISMNEVLLMDDRVRDAVSRCASANEIQRLALAGGMQSMLWDGMRKASEGLTTVEEVLRAVHE
jgi:type IV pilus assembly protein PilB